MSTGRLRIQQVRSGIGAPRKHKKILQALGLGRIDRVVELPDNGAVRGMVAKIPHLVRIVPPGEAAGRRTGRSGR
ncbi:MAG: 50S ribosomal protein L30 [Acidobacteria bacterium]|nr:MAG: 50S ribosomal protein L30 [Acidobacteriota bacterium]